MNTAEQILVIVLAAALALFLIIAIMIAVQVLRLVKVLRTMADKAEQLVNSAESAAELFKSTVGKFTVLRFAHSIFDMVVKHKSKD
jgi:cell division protein FtsB